MNSIQFKVLQRKYQNIIRKVRNQIHTSLGTFSHPQQYGEFNLLYRVNTRENKDLIMIYFNH